MAKNRDKKTKKSSLKFLDLTLVSICTRERNPRKIPYKIFLTDKLAKKWLQEDKLGNEKLGMERYYGSESVQANFTTMQIIAWTIGAIVFDLRTIKNKVKTWMKLKK